MKTYIHAKFHAYLTKTLSGCSDRLAYIYVYIYTHTINMCTHTNIHMHISPALFLAARIDSDLHRTTLLVHLILHLSQLCVNSFLRSCIMYVHMYVCSVYMYVFISAMRKFVSSILHHVRIDPYIYTYIRTYVHIYSVPRP